MNTPIERLQTALETLGLKAVEARLENSLGASDVHSSASQSASGAKASRFW
jgi:hypothetical protein